MLNKLIILLEISRFFSLPMTIMSWLVIFTYGALNSGDIANGIIAFFGIAFVHLATNIFDDYFDYKALIKQVNFDKHEYLKNSQKTKCRYIIQGIITENEILILGLSYLGIAGIFGIYLYFVCGKWILYYTLIGAFISISYSIISRIKLSEIAVAIAYGPALFGGVYYAMTKTNSWEVFILAIPSMIMTVILLYTHTVMDYEYDLNEGKLTLANSFNSQLDSLIVLKIFLICAYISPILLCIFDIADWQVLLVYITIPLAYDLYSSMTDFAINSNSVPKSKWYHFPMENKTRLESLNAWSFMTRMYQSRNLMVYFSFILIIGLICSVS